MQEIAKSNKKIKSLEVLRCLAFLGVFVEHTGIDIFKSLGYWGVSIFLVLSGFLMVYSYKDKELYVPNIMNNIKFAINKMKPLYLLHIVTMLAMIPFEIIGEKTNSLVSIIISVIINILCVQDWIPFGLRSLNGSSWYLCTLFFFYIIFPYVHSYIKSKCTSNKALINIAVCMILKVAICFIGKNLMNTSISNNLFELDLTYWFVYHFPLSRILEVSIGCSLAYLFINDETLFAKDNTGFEVLTLFISVLAIYISYLSIPTIYVENNVLMSTANNNRWWNNSLIFMPSSILLIMLFSYENNRVPKLLTNRASLYLASISKYAFLIHDVLFSYISAILFRIPTIGGEIFHYRYGGIIKLTVGFALTIIACELWIRICNIVKIRRK